MSIQPRRSSKTAAKRRAAARRRTRTIGRHLFAYFAILLLVIGTISTVVLGTAPTVQAPAVDVGSTPSSGPGVGALLTLADKSFTAGEWLTATNLYRAYLGQSPENAEAHYKLGKSILSGTNPNYVEALAHLQQAVNIAPGASFASDAQSLIAQYASKVTPPASGTITGTTTSPGAVITGTASLPTRAATGTNSLPSTSPTTNTPTPAP